MDRPEPEQESRGWLRAIALALAVGIVLGWAAVFLIPTARSLGLPQGIASQLPYFGFVLGVLWGLVAKVSKSVKDLLLGLATPPLVGAVFYFFGVLLGGLFVGMGMREESADWVPAICFLLGALLGSVPLVVVAWGAVFPARRA